jgi:hypothetical protein
MSAIAALEAARAAGVRLKVEGDDLVLEASAAPPSAVLDLLSRNKAGIATILRPGLSGWSVEDWHAFFAERAGVAEFDGALPRPQAEERAFTCCVAEWLNHSAVASTPGRCLGCSCTIMRKIRCCLTASKRPGMSGCMRAAGQLGMRAGRPRLSLRWRSLA